MQSYARNIMDYLPNGFEKISLYYWQWRIINENIIIKGLLQWEE
jgi:hypothetical protein